MALCRIPFEEALPPAASLEEDCAKAGGRRVGGLCLGMLAHPAGLLELYQNGKQFVGGALATLRLCEKKVATKG